MRHEDLCERARRWLSGTRRCEPVFSGIASCSEIPDAIGWSSKWAWHGSTVVEAKTSRSDFYADGRKYIGYRDEEAKWNIPSRRITQHRGEQMGLKKIDLPRMGDFRFFICEPEIITDEMVGKNAPDHGLLWVDSGRVRVVRGAERRQTGLIDKDGEIRYLRFAIINRKQPQVLAATPEGTVRP